MGPTSIIDDSCHSSAFSHFINDPLLANDSESQEMIDDLFAGDSAAAKSIASQQAAGSTLAWEADTDLTAPANMAFLKSVAEKGLALQFGAAMGSADACSALH